MSDEPDDPGLADESLEDPLIDVVADVSQVPVLIEQEHNQRCVAAAEEALALSQDVGSLLRWLQPAVEPKDKPAASGSEAQASPAK